MQQTYSNAPDAPTYWSQQARAGSTKQGSMSTTTQMVNYNPSDPTPLNAASPFGADAYHSETRKISSVVIESSTVGEAPDMEDRVPTIEEQIKYVTVYEKREVEKRVPKYETEYVDKVVEVPKYVWVDVPNKEKKYVERIVENKVPYPVNRIREIPREVKIVKPRYIEKIVEVPGDVIEVPVYHDVQKVVEVPRHVDREIPVIVAQTIKPIITESNTTHEVDVLDYEPEVMPVDVHIAKPVASALEIVGQRDLKHRLVNVTSGQYNTVLKLLNANASEITKQSLPYVAEYGKIPFAPEHEAHFIVAPPNVEIEGWNRPAVQQVQQREVASLGSHMMVSSQQANEAACCRNNKKKPMTVVSNMQQQQQQQDGVSSHHHRHHHSVAQTSDVYTSSYQQQRAPSTHHSQPRQARDASQSQTYTEIIDELAKDGSTTVLSQRPHAKSRVCC